MRNSVLSSATLLLASTHSSLAFPFSWASLPDMKAGFIADSVNVLVPNRIGIYLCKNANWEQPCEKLANGPGICINLSDELSGEVSSVGPDKEASGCTLFEYENANVLHHREENCRGEQLQGLKYPGESDLSQGPQAGKFNDVFRSYICY